MNKIILGTLFCLIAGCGSHHVTPATIVTGVKTYNCSNYVVESRYTICRENADSSYARIPNDAIVQIQDPVNGNFVPFSRHTHTEGNKQHTEVVDDE